MSEKTQERAAVTVPYEFTKELTISVNVSNLQQALDWYRDVLGFEVVYQLDELGWAEVASPIAGVTVGLSQTEEQKVGGTVPTFSVVDIEAATGHLRAKGVRQDDIFEVDGMVKLAGFYDPDGNPWMFAQNLQGG